jgi:hypothetical protein
VSGSSTAGGSMCDKLLGQVKKPKNFSDDHHFWPQSTMKSSSRDRLSVPNCLQVRMTESQGSSSIDDTKQEIALSIKGLTRSASLGINNFTFIAGIHRFECNKFEAAFLSPTVTNLLVNDCMLCEYDLGDCDLDSDTFHEFLSICRGSSFVVTDSNFESIKSLSKSLGNDELRDILFSSRFSDNDLTVEDSIKRVEFHRLFECSSSTEIDFLASHFFEIDESFLRSLDLPVFEAVVSSESLKLLDEDSLLTAILDFGSSGLSLLHHIQSEYLSVDGINRLLNSISFDDLNKDLWSSLCRRLRSPISISSLPCSRFRGWVFELDSSRRFEGGIISHLTPKSGENVHTLGIVSITASSSSRNQCYQVADYEWKDYWNSSSASGSWIQFDFKDRRISVSDYTIKSDGHGGSHLRHWSVEGSTDGQSWVSLDRRDTSDLNGDYIVRSYHCTLSDAKSFFRYIRLIQTGTNSSNYHQLQLCNLEFFGSLSHD